MIRIDAFRFDKLYSNKFGKLSFNRRSNIGR